MGKKTLVFVKKRKANISNPGMAGSLSRLLVKKEKPMISRRPEGISSELA